MNLQASTRDRRCDSGSVLIIVLWVAFGLVTIALYFAQSMTMEFRASDNRIAALQASQAIEGALRFLSGQITNVPTPGEWPELLEKDIADVPVGEAAFWLIGRETNLWQSGPAKLTFGLVDEGSKLNLNTVSATNLELLPRMTTEFAAAIVDWRDSDSDVTDGGAEDEIYGRLATPYRCKNAPFESVEELRLVTGADLELLFGEDRNLNGVLDFNEDDANATLPEDNRDGRLDPGLLEYVTVWSREPNTTTNGSLKIDVSSTNQTALATRFQTEFGTSRANQILARVGLNPVGSLLEFYSRSGMTADEFAQIENEISTSTNAFIPGRINVNTASEAVLACVPGIGLENAGLLVSQRASNAGRTPSIAWVADVLGTNAIAAGPFITSRSYQFTADVAAVGRHGRVYQRVRYVIDIAEGTPKVLYRRDLTHLGWALGREVRLQLAKQDRQLK